MSENNIDMKEIKPGIKTTEFWTALIAVSGNIILILAAMNQIDHEAVEPLTKAVTEIIGAASVLFANAFIIINYVQSRTKLKMLN